MKHCSIIFLKNSLNYLAIRDNNFPNHLKTQYSLGGINILRLLILALLFFISYPIVALSTTSWNGKVVKVADGDTITVLHNGKPEKIRLAGIDTPEKKQAYGQAAKKYTESMVAGKTVTIKPVTTDKYGRTVAIVFVNGSNLNEQIVANGYGWVYKKYCNQSYCRDWLKLENHAKSFYFGLWKDPNPQAPWEWRHNKKSISNKSTNVIGGTGIYHGNKRSHALHSSTCKHYNCKNCTVIFNSVQDGVNAGYRPHYECIKQ